MNYLCIPDDQGWTSRQMDITDGDKEFGRVGLLHPGRGTA